MAGLGPWEAAPRFAVAVSGGADSLALALLLAEWARTVSGEVLALIVDHRLRRGSGAEAARVRGWLSDRGLAAEILRRTDPAPSTGIEEEARLARYRLLVERCLDRRIPSLLVAHHRDDQAETFLHRLARGSGPRGLAAMSPIAFAPGSRGRVRLLRPLLDLPKERLVATLSALRQPWIEDPMNLDPAFARTRIRAIAPRLAEAGLGADRLAETAARLGLAREAIDRAAADWLARAAVPSPLGWIALRLDGIAALPAMVAERAVESCLMTVSGASYPPRRERLRRLLARLGDEGDGNGRLAGTLGGCRFRKDRVGRLLIFREERAAVERLIAKPGLTLWWDSRFEVSLAPAGRRRAERGAILARLGAVGWARIATRIRAEGGIPAPAAALASLPALWDDGGLIEAPYLGYRREKASGRVLDVRFVPRQPLSG